MTDRPPEDPTAAPAVAPAAVIPARAPRVIHEGDFALAPFSEIDVRFLLGRAEWKDYMDELDEIRHAPHRGPDPDEYPCVAMTAWLGGEWVHQSMGARWVDYMRILRDGRSDMYKVRRSPWRMSATSRMRRRIEYYELGGKDLPDEGAGIPDDGIVETKGEVRIEVYEPPEDGEVS